MGSIETHIIVGFVLKDRLLISLKLTIIGN